MTSPGTTGQLCVNHSSSVAHRRSLCTASYSLSLPRHKRCAQGHSPTAYVAAPRRTPHDFSLYHRRSGKGHRIRGSAPDRTQRGFDAAKQRCCGRSASGQSSSRQSKRVRLIATASLRMSPDRAHPKTFPLSSDMPRAVFGLANVPSGFDSPAGPCGPVAHVRVPAASHSSWP